MATYQAEKQTKRRGLVLLPRDTALQSKWPLFERQLQHIRKQHVVFMQSSGILIWEYKLKLCVKNIQVVNSISVIACEMALTILSS